MNTNRTREAAVPQNTVRDLATLQNELQPVLAILDQLNISGLTGNQLTSPNDTRANGLIPTGP
jgi:hypothetical protein